MASSQGLYTPNGKFVSFDDINAILTAVDTGQPIQIHVVSDPAEHCQKRAHLQIQKGSDGSTDTNKFGSNSIKHIGKPHDSLALVNQIQNLQLSDGQILQQVLASSQPEALSELNKARKNNSMIPLVTAKDGRLFSILVERLANNDWGDKYPMELVPDAIRKLNDPTPADDEITAYLNAKLKEILVAVSQTKESCEFRKSVEVLRPKIWENYRAMIAEPVDLSSMHHLLSHNRYPTMADFKRHVDLLQENAERFNGDRNKFIIEAAIKVKAEIYRKMDEIPNEKSVDGRDVHQVRQTIYAYNDDGDDGESSSSMELSGSRAGNREAGYPFLVLPWGRLCVARGAADNEVVKTPYIVAMDVGDGNKGLWMVKDQQTPIGLPDDKVALLDFGGAYNFTIALLAKDIGHWKMRGSRDVQGPMLSWETVEKLVPKFSGNRSVLFDLVGPQQAATAIEKARDIPAESSEDEDSSVSDEEFDVDNHNDNDDESDLDWVPEPALGRKRGASKRRVPYGRREDDDEYQSVRKRTKQATAADHSLGRWN
ncbi:transcription initiation at TATA-containing promoter protein [Diaporthe australafricana]|uniref:Transcription initiation at TATA-containing promoter protein n=1 Tax=Diaporthe australafricana TaxID=127596 RepID=A0ABR3XHY3_9PEZI